MRYALAALVALAIGSQADAQQIRRFARSYTPGYQTYYTAPSYAVPNTVVTAGYYSPYSDSNSYVYPTTYYAPSVVYGYSNLGYSNLGYSNYGYSNYGYSNLGYSNYGYSRGYGRRGYRW